MRFTPHVKRWKPTWRLSSIHQHRPPLSGKRTAGSNCRKPPGKKQQLSTCHGLKLSTIPIPSIVSHNNIPWLTLSLRDPGRSRQGTDQRVINNGEGLVSCLVKYTWKGFSAANCPTDEGCGRGRGGGDEGGKRVQDGDTGKSEGGKEGGHQLSFPQQHGPVGTSNRTAKAFYNSGETCWRQTNRMRNMGKVLTSILPVETKEEKKKSNKRNTID